MSTTKVTVAQLRDHLAEYLGKVFYTGETLVVCKYGKPWAVISAPAKKSSGKKTDFDKFFGFLPNDGISGEAFVNKIRRNPSEKKRTELLRGGHI